MHETYNRRPDMFTAAIDLALFASRFHRVTTLSLEDALLYIFRETKCSYFNKRGFGPLPLAIFKPYYALK